MATEHLLGLGHRSVAFSAESRGRQTSFGDGRRLEGYLSAMRDAGLDGIRSSCRCRGDDAGRIRRSGGAARRPAHATDALVGVCDEVAIGAIIAARRLGIHVPRT